MSRNLGRRIVLVDCDGPLSDFNGATEDFVSEQLGYQWTAPKRWDLCAELPVELQNKVLELWRSPGFATSLRVVDGAEEAVARIASEAELYIVTAPMEGSLTWGGEREVWLKRRLGVDRRFIVSAVPKHLICGDYFIDDKVSNIDDWGAAPRGAFMPCGPRQALLWKMAHNAEHHTRHGADNWPDMLRLVLG